MAFDVAGLRAYAADLRRAPERLRGDVETVMRASAARLEQAQKIKAAVDTGLMRSTIAAHDEQYGGSSMSVSVGPTVPYAVYVEFGTSRMAPQPFVGPSLDVVEPQFLAALGIAAAKALP